MHLYVRTLSVLASTSKKVVQLEQQYFVVNLWYLVYSIVAKQGQDFQEAVSPGRRNNSFPLVMAPISDHKTWNDRSGDMMIFTKEEGWEKE